MDDPIAIEVCKQMDLAAMIDYFRSHIGHEHDNSRQLCADEIRLLAEVVHRRFTERVLAIAVAKEAIRIAVERGVTPAELHAMDGAWVVLSMTQESGRVNAVVLEDDADEWRHIELARQILGKDSASQ